MRVGSACSSTAAHPGHPTWPPPPPASPPAETLLAAPPLPPPAPRAAPARSPPRRYVLKNIARDWSEEGAAERAQSYGRILRELRRLFAGWPAGAAEPPSVLVPGAGLARLCLEVVDMVGAVVVMWWWW